MKHIKLAFILLSLTIPFIIQPKTYAQPKLSIDAIFAPVSLFEIITADVKHLPPPSPIPPKPIYKIIDKGRNPDGNWFTWGNCTWFVANNYNVPNNWSHARFWYDRATTQGYYTSSVPIKGAIAWVKPASRGYGWYGHVAIVIDVSNNGFTIREMNARGLNKISEREIYDVAKWRFIYPIAP
ncbi:surface antigen [Caudoviricetes sp.]|nr:surface antigen [Caudoviricetes sp.]